MDVDDHLEVGGLFKGGRNLIEVFNEGGGIEEADYLRNSGPGHAEEPLEAALPDRRQSHVRREISVREVAIAMSQLQIGEGGVVAAVAIAAVGGLRLRPGCGGESVVVVIPGVVGLQLVATGAVATIVLRPVGEAVVFPPDVVSLDLSVDERDQALHFHRRERKGEGSGGSVSGSPFLLWCFIPLTL